MLDELSVTNLGIISSARITPGPGMVVVSGETGAGKTLLLGALRLLTGAPARAGLIGPGGEEAVVEGRFILDGGETAAARRIHARGSRAYLDGAMVPAKALAERLDGLVEIVGQHDPLSLTRPRTLRNLIDQRLESPEPLEEYRAAWERVRELESDRAALGGGLSALEREMDLLRYQIEEIEKAGFRIGEDAELERRANRLGNAGQIREMLGEARTELAEAQDRVGPAVSMLREASRLDPSQDPLRSMLEDLDAGLSEAAAGVREAWEGVEDDPKVLASVNERLALLGDLRRKYGAGIEEILAFGEAARVRRAEAGRLLERAAALDADQAEASRTLERAGRALQAARRTAASHLAEGAAAHLLELGFSDPVVRIEVEEAPPRPAGADSVELLFASDSRLAAGPVGRVASGGELSRLVLSLRLAAGASAARVVAFDEIDAGVGGAAALEMGAKLARLSRGRQTLCVSHLPQVAAFADSHITVERDGPAASVRMLDGEERLRELSRMLSGLADSERGHRHAGELRAFARARRQEK